MMQRSFFSSEATIVYTVEEAAAVLHVSAREVNRLIQQRELDCFYLGRKRSLRRIAAFSLQEFIRKKVDVAKSTKKFENS